MYVCVCVCGERERWKSRKVEKKREMKEARNKKSLFFKVQYSPLHF